MSIIKTCGGYDKAKIYVEQFKKLNLDAAAKLFEDELLEYRRANNIFEVGDFVVYESECKSNKVYEIESLGGDMGDLTLVGGMKPWDFQVRHATPEEIKEGHRL